MGRGLKVVFSRDSVIFCRALFAKATTASQRVSHLKALRNHLHRVEPACYQSSENRDFNPLKRYAGQVMCDSRREHSSLFPTFIMSDSFYSFGLSQVVVPSSRMPVGRNLAPIPHPGVSYVRGEPGVPRIRSVRATMHACVLRWSQTAVVDPRCVLKPKHKKGGGGQYSVPKPLLSAEEGNSTWIARDWIGFVSG